LAIGFAGFILKNQHNFEDCLFYENLRQMFVKWFFVMN